MTVTGNLREVAPVAALAFANEVRADHGLPALTALLPGIPDNSCMCPIANTIAHGMHETAPEVSGRRATMSDPFGWLLNSEHAVPSDVSDFIFLFDKGEYPELIA